MPVVKMILLFAAMIIIGPGGGWFILWLESPEDSGDNHLENDELEEEK